MFKININFGNDNFKVEAIVTRNSHGWCVMVGDNTNERIAGFGEELWEAIRNFKNNFRNA